MNWKPGDIANGHILGSDNQWHPLGQNGETQRSVSVPPAPASREGSVSGNRQGKGCGALVAIGLGLLLLFVIVGSLVEAAPSTLVLPDFSGKDCKESQAKVDRLFDETKEDSFQDDTMAVDSPYICTGGVAYRTDPAAGTKLDLDAQDTIAIRWWSIEPEAYDWYTAHKTVPDYAGYYFKSFGTEPPAAAKVFDPGKLTKYFVEDEDRSLVPTSSSGYYSDGPHRILRTTPAAGKPISMGQEITFHTQVERGKWNPYESGGDSGGVSGSYNDDDDFNVPGWLCPTRFC